ncbi:MAG TPA: hypothetical protein VIH42_10685, partial [Thermoguttaceae bacterium]
PDAKLFSSCSFSFKRTGAKANNIRTKLTGNKNRRDSGASCREKLSRCYETGVAIDQCPGRRNRKEAGKNGERRWSAPRFNVQRSDP